MVLILSIDSIPCVVALCNHTADQAIPRSEEVDEDDAEDWWKGIGKVVWVIDRFT
jgi:hypothetical protein